MSTIKSSNEHLTINADGSGNDILFQSNGSQVASISDTGVFNITTVDLGNWTITESSGVLYFATGGTNKMKLDASGNLTCVGDVTANGSM